MLCAKSGTPGVASPINSRRMSGVLRWMSSEVAQRHIVDLASRVLASSRVAANEARMAAAGPARKAPVLLQIPRLWLLAFNRSLKSHR